MNFNLYTNPICGEEIPHFLFFDFSTAHPFLFYSYIPIVIISFLISFFIYQKNKGSLQAKLLFSFVAFFVLWVLNILVQWVASYHSILMYAWQLTAIFEVGMYILALYFSYVFLYQKDLSFIYKLTLVVIGLVVVFLTPTTYNISLYDVYNCEGVVGSLWSFIYVFELAVVVLVTFLGIHKIYMLKEKKDKKLALLFTAGISAFLAIFFFSNFYGELTKVYEFNFWGPLGMVIFLLIFAYIVSQYKLFNAKVFSSQFLVLILSALIFTLFFITDEEVRILISTVALSGTLVFGFLLIRSVTKEVIQKEYNKKLADDLRSANNRLIELNKQKSEFISFATHQLRSPLTAMKGYASLILEGDYGKVDDQLRGAVSRILDSSNTLVSVVDDYLNISRIELGTMKYNFMPLDFRSIVNNVMAEMMPTIEKTGLSFSFIADKTQKYPIDADPDKFRQVISNLVDNALKYTKEGSIAITLTKNNGKILFTIKDTGIGMSKELLPKLFQKFTRAHNANEANIRGTGLGLYVAKEIVTAHNGKLWAESDGDGKGSQFYVEMEEKK